MTPSNFYPEVPVMPFGYKTLPMDTIIAAIKALPTVYNIEQKRALYVILRNETGNGHAVIGGTNPSGVQSDSGRWSRAWDKHIVGTCIHPENMTGRTRGFVIFDSLQSGVEFTMANAANKGLYIGEHVDSKYYKGDVDSPARLAMSYYDEWVVGKVNAPAPADFAKEFLSMYAQSEKIFVS